MQQFRPDYLYRGTGPTHTDPNAVSGLTGDNIARSSDDETVLATGDDYLYVGVKDSPMDFLYFFLARAQNGREGIKFEIADAKKNDSGNLVDSTDWTDIYDDFEDIWNEANEGTINQFDFSFENPIYIADQFWSDWDKAKFGGKEAFWLRISWKDQSAAPTTTPKICGLWARRVESYCTVNNVSRFIQIVRTLQGLGEISDTSYPSIKDVRRLIWQSQAGIDQITHRQWRPVFVHREAHDYLTNKLLFPLRRSGPIKILDPRLYNRGSIYNVDIGRDEEIFLDKGGSFVQLTLPRYYMQYVGTKVPKVFINKIIKDPENLVFKVSYLACEPPFDNTYAKVELLAQIKTAVFVLQSYNQQSISPAAAGGGQVTITGLIDRYERQAREIEGELIRSVVI